MKKRTIGTFAVILIFAVLVFGIIFSNGEDNIPEVTIDRKSKIPEDAVKVLPEEDFFPPILHSYEYENPIPMSGPINTAGGEDSPFITYDGNYFYFFFTPDVEVPVEEQITDEVTGIYMSEKIEGVWSEPVRVILQDPDKLALDGCPCIIDDIMWFCSAREGYTGVRFFTSQYVNNEWQNWQYIGDKLSLDYEVGELHITSDGNELYFHSQRSGGKGQLDIWLSKKVSGEWVEPMNIDKINTVDNEGWPFVTQNGTELWFTRFYRGYPAIFRSKIGDGELQEPELILSRFAAEPTIDEEGNIYFAHHFFKNGEMIEADIYVAKRRLIENVTPADSIDLPLRGFYKGFLPFPSTGQSFNQVYQEASQTVEFAPIWGRPTPFYGLAEELNGSWGETFIENYTRGNGMFPLIHTSFIGYNLSLKTPPGMYDVTLDDPEWRQAYKKAIVDIVLVTKPLYVSLGNEVNRWYEKYGANESSSNGFQHYVSLYEEIYDIIKIISPKTKVFCTFAREIVSEFREADLNVLELFNPDKIDILMFTSYPYAVKGINNPEDIPNNYYKKAFEYFPNKQFGFSEIAWPSLEDFGGEQGQADFITYITSRLTVDNGIDLHILGWAWLHDINKNDYTGLKKTDGSEKLAFEIWKNL
jgi:hypothetical protein